ncbi:DUF4231 domain-containing protein [Poseidonibacter lekithochrous]|uniref:DUF4231 domain-containing protein n=1 Tax=Poseidonibacter lekithochrous TaxID=1904463 RepID=UPI0008FC60E0|nr:DUF4231 domain-containing protein [Poseidonibacter lekithochrous]QKJ22614.1 DUF4231 domain-containing membrane protein [Poseidonibacter lekithochrous]
MDLELNSKTLPGLHKLASDASSSSQKNYFLSLGAYLFLVIIAVSVSFYFPKDAMGAIISASFFFITLGILIALKYFKPDDQWYNGRAVAESVKTRSWRWCMRAEPYLDNVDIQIVSKEFMGDLKSILDQNKNLSKTIHDDETPNEPISETMKKIRKLSFEDRLEIYTKQRILDQSKWYSKKANYNKKKAKFWFIVSILLHVLAIGFLLFRIKDPELSLPVDVIATMATAVFTWIQAKKHNELVSSYTLTAHEITIIKGESSYIKDEKELSDFVLNSENAFSREHTQWVARKLD